MNRSQRKIWKLAARLTAVRKLKYTTARMQLAVHHRAEHHHHPPRWSRQSCA
jgi:hypothetical protein